MKCRKCGSENLAPLPKSNSIAYDLYCRDCGAWLNFATKEERRKYEGDPSKSVITCPCCNYPITIEVKIK